MRLAIFDLDNTLLAGDSDHAWGEFMIGKGLVNAKTHSAANDRFYQSYTNGNLDINEYVKFTLGPVLAMSITELATLHKEFMQAYILPIILPKARKLIEQHKQLGDLCLIMSATNSFITRPIAAELQVHDILATDLVERDGFYTGAILGTPCFQEGKVQRLQQWMTLQTEAFLLEQGVFYSDSHNDLPLLNSIGTPIAVDPDARLRKFAENNAWKIISLR